RPTGSRPTACCSAARAEARRSPPRDTPRSSSARPPRRLPAWPPLRRMFRNKIRILGPPHKTTEGRPRRASRAGSCISPVFAGARPGGVGADEGSGQRGRGGGEREAPEPQPDVEQGGERAAGGEPQDRAEGAREARPHHGGLRRRDAADEPDGV